ncbi:ABC transporter permease [Thermopolyspora sp. NPDC052614]|uniref:ABC transporter permease n=1 Tax=Thermopolyspora sp. NPDC052614 TaxID=3155682 RepID=UPI0034273410
MGPVWLAARREIAVRSRSTGYRVGLAITVLLVIVLVALPRLFDGGDAYTVGVAGAQGDQLATALSAQGKPAEDLTIKVVRHADETAARAAVEAGDVDAAVVDNTKVISESALDNELSVIIDTAHRSVATQQNLRTAGLDPGAVQRALQTTPLAEVTLSPTAEDAALRRVIASAIVVMLFILIVQSCSMVAMGVVEEKGSRIVEILLASVRPWQLLAGKTIGLGVLGLLQIMLIAVVGLAGAQLSGAVPDMPDGIYGVIAVTILWFLLGYAFYAVMFAGIASLVSRQEELQGVLTPATMLLMVSYFVAFVATADPTGAVTRVLSIVPPFSSMIMPVRAAGAEVPLWESALALGLMVLAVLGMLWLGGRVYQRAVLRTGARVRYREVLRAR